MSESIKIVGFSMLAAALYGIAHDMVTAHLSVEYFTIAHPPLLATENPALLALGWGVVATWWVGLILGLALAAACRFGNRHKLGLADVRSGIVRLMLVAAMAALLAGSAGIAIAAFGDPPIGTWQGRIAPDRQIPFAGALFAHGASYVVGFVGGLFLCAWTWQRRREPE